MIERLEKPPVNLERSSVSAEARARLMLCELCGPRGWHDTRESWLARGARKCALTLRRAKALFYEEPLRLTANEYLRIQDAHQAAHAVVATISTLARGQDLRPREENGLRGRAADSDR